MITLANVGKTYPGGITAVEDLSFTINDGEFCVLIGPSGCGKSTTLKMINRLISLSSGSITVDGEEISGYRPEILRRRIGYSIQTVGLFPHMTVAQNIGTVPKLLKWEKGLIEKRINNLLEMLNLDPGTYRDKYPRQLSGGKHRGSESPEPWQRIRRSSLWMNRSGPSIPSPARPFRRNLRASRGS